MKTVSAFIRGIVPLAFLLSLACNRGDEPIALSQPKPVILTNTGQRVRLSAITTKSIFGKYTVTDHFKYDSKGRLVAIVFSSSSEPTTQSDTFAYNSRDQLLTIDHTYGIALFGYGEGFSLSSRIYNQRKVYRYDNDGHIESITELADTTGKGNFGQLSQTVLTYDNNDFPQSMTITKRFNQMRQTYQSLNGNITSVNQLDTYTSNVGPFGGVNSNTSSSATFSDTLNVFRGFDGIAFNPHNYFNKNFATNGEGYIYDQRGLPVSRPDYNNVVEYSYETY